MRQAQANSTWRVAGLVVLALLSAGAQVASAQVRINLLHVGVGPSFGLPLSIAQEHGLFAKHGMEVRLVLVPGADVPRLTGDSPLGYIGAPAVLLRAAEGADLKILGSFITDRVAGHLVARPDIKKPEELRGKRVGVRALGALAWIQTILALEHLGLDPTRDNITVLAIGDRQQALEAGTIEAAVLSPAESRQLTPKGFSVLLDLYPASLHVPQNALAVTGPYLQQSPDVVERVVAALIEGIAFSLSPTNKPTVLNTIMKTFRVTDPAAAEDSYSEYLRAVVRKPYPPSADRLRNMQRIMARHDPKVLNVRIEDLVDDRFVRKLDATGVIDRLYSAYGVR
jgi:ABC-type nitrate/sulfonate/bicarbonate transport system substrate-binding protein